MKGSARLAPAAIGVLALAACADPVAPPAATESLPPSSARTEGAPGRPIPDQYIVVFKDDVRDVPGVARGLARTHGASVRFQYQHAIKGFAGRMNAQAAAAMARNPNVAYVEQDEEVSISETTQANATWGLDRIDAASGLDQSYTYDNNGNGVNAYIIDTGILLSHTDFGGRAVTGFDAVTSGGNASDCNGHGTHVAGTVGGSTWGVAKGVKLHAVRVLDCNGSGSWSGVIAGMDWVTANHDKPAVANMSLGGGASSSVDDATRRMIAAGVATAVAAGNGNRAGIAQDACNYSPARVAEAMTIGATTKTDAKTSWSNYGACVDWFAPGASITSAWYTSSTATNTISGTSMASPHVAGVAALYLHSNSGASPEDVRTALYDLTTKGIVSSSSTANNHLLFSRVGGGGGGGEEPVNEAPTASFSTSCSGMRCTFTDGSTDSDGAVVAWTWNFGNGTSDEPGPHVVDYTTEGQYVVTLTVTDNDGAKSSASKNLSCRKRGKNVSCQ